jgi:hypothetical protein
MTHLQGLAAQVEQGLDHADWSTRRQIIRALVKRVEIGAETVSIVYRVAPVPFVERAPTTGAFCNIVQSVACIAVQCAQCRPGGLEATL